MKNCAELLFLDFSTWSKKLKNNDSANFFEDEIKLNTVHD